MRIQIARATRSSVLRSMPQHESAPELLYGMPRMQQTVIELALIHRLLGTQIALVLGMDIRDVRRLANEGLTAAARGLPKTAGVEDS